MTGQISPFVFLYMVILTKMQKRKNPENEICLSDIWKHKLFKIVLSFDLLQVHLTQLFNQRSQIF